MSAVAREENLSAADVELTPMRRRHIRSVMRIENLVYPRPWSAALFLQEMARRADRVYLVARAGLEVVGYGGLMISGAEGHITTIAVDPQYHRRHIGSKIMFALMDAAIGRAASAVSLEVRKSNLGAQKLYELFGFQPVGIRKGYYIETGEDAVVMWAGDVNTAGYLRRLNRLRQTLLPESE